jgi:hypothetical protein
MAAEVDRPELRSAFGASRRRAGRDVIGSRSCSGHRTRVGRGAVLLAGWLVSAAAGPAPGQGNVGGRLRVGEAHGAGDGQGGDGRTEGLGKARGYLLERLRGSGPEGERPARRPADSHHEESPGAGSGICGSACRRTEPLPVADARSCFRACGRLIAACRPRPCRPRAHRQHAAGARDGWTPDPARCSSSSNRRTPAARSRTGSACR